MQKDMGKNGTNSRIKNFEVFRQVQEKVKNKQNKKENKMKKIKTKNNHDNENKI